MEYVPGGELLNFLHKEEYGRFYEPRATFYIKQIYDALEYKKSIMKKNPKDRITIQEVKKHLWILNNEIKYIGYKNIINKIFKFIIIIFIF